MSASALWEEEAASPGRPSRVRIFRYRFHIMMPLRSSMGSMNYGPWQDVFVWPTNFFKRL
jgi:hypothetical protein